MGFLGRQQHSPCKTVQILGLVNPLETTAKNLDEAIANKDAIILAQNHKDFQKIDVERL